MIRKDFHFPKLDTIAIINASQELSGEIILDKLLTKLMKIIIENSGAATGYLLLESDGRFTIEASASVDPENITVGQSLPVEQGENLSPVIVNYTARTRVPVVLNNAAKEDIFANDPSIRSRQPNSVLCMPILSASRLIGLLYLENNLVSGAFTAERQETLKVLTTQAAISLENAKLYTDLEQEIIERKGAEKKLKQSKDALLTIFEAMPFGIIIVDGDKKIRYVNNTALALIGCKSKKNILGTICHKNICPAEVDNCPILDLGMKVDSSEGTLITKDKKQIPMLKSVVPIILDGEECLLESFVDISERKKAEEELRKHREHLEELVEKRTAELAVALERAQESDRLKSSFLASMSHELRTPLNSIIGFTGIILQGMVGELNDEQRKQLNMVYSSAKHLLGLINDVLDLSKIESGKVEIASSRFELAELIQLVEKMVSPMAEEKGLKLGVTVSDGTPSAIYGDKNRIKQVLINLL